MGERGGTVPDRPPPGKRIVADARAPVIALRAMRLLSDFDGVWTDPAAEATAQGEVMNETWAEWARHGGPDGLGDWLDAARRAVAAEPTAYGWLSSGRISAWADEDPFVSHGALLHYVHVRSAHDPVAAWIARETLAHGHADLDAFGGDSHHRGVVRVAERRGPAILDDAVAAGRAMLGKGVEIEVVSNSQPAKLEKWFGHAGLPYRLHPERGDRALTLRGGARKFVLDPAGPDPLALGDLAVDVARPHYRAVLLEERPDAIVGDVFSLDLALPLALRRREPGWGAVRLFWLLRPYTPRWLVEHLARHAPEVEPLAGGLADVASRLA